MTAVSKARSKVNYWLQEFALNLGGECRIRLENDTAIVDVPDSIHIVIAKGVVYGPLHIPFQFGHVDKIFRSSAPLKTLKGFPLTVGEYVEIYRAGITTLAGLSQCPVAYIKNCTELKHWDIPITGKTRFVFTDNIPTPTASEFQMLVETKTSITFKGATEPPRWFQAYQNSLQDYLCFLSSLKELYDVELDATSAPPVFVQPLDTLGT